MSGFPNDWQVQRLSELGFAYSGLSGKSKEDFGSGSKYVPYKNVFFNTFVDLNYVEQVNVLPDETQNKVQQGDVLLTISSETPEEVGMSAVVAEEVEGDLYLNSFCFGFRPTDDRLLPQYLGYAFRADYMRSKLVFLAQGSTRFNISKGRVLDIELPIPPSAEQQKIAAILTAVDDKLDLIALQISATQTLKQGLMQTLFTRGAGKQVASKWPTVLLHEVAEVRTGVAKGKKGLREPVTLPYLRVANVQDGHIDLREVKDIEVEASQVERYALRAGDVLMTEGGDFDKLGRGDVWKGQISPCLHQNHVFAVRPDASKLNSYYLAAFAGSAQGRQYFLGCAKRTTNLASINSSQLKAFPVLLPPLEIQQYIADANDAANSKIATLTTQQTHYQSLKRGLMQKLLTGQWRVRVDAATLAPIHEEAPA